MVRESFGFEVGLTDKCLLTYPNCQGAVRLSKP